MSAPPLTVLLLVLLAVGHLVCAGSAPTPAPSPTLVRMAKAPSALARRSVSLSTMSPVSLYSPDLEGDVAKGKDPDGKTKVYYLGKGYHTETSVYALVAGSAGREKTAYLYHASTQLYLPHLYRTATLKNGTTVSGIFNIGCKYKNGMGSGGACTMMYQMGPKETTKYRTTKHTIDPMTTVTPVRGQLQAEIAKTASKPTPRATGATSGAARHVGSAAWPTVITIIICIIAGTIL